MGLDDLDMQVSLIRAAGDEVADAVSTLPLEPVGDGRYIAEATLNDPGTYRWTVDAKPGAIQVGVLSDVTL